MTGQALVEYLLILAILVAVSIGALRMFTSAWEAKFTMVSTTRAGALGMLP